MMYAPTDPLVAQSGDNMLPTASNPRVLCVDDDEDAREMLSLLLKYWRIETKTAGTAAQALSLIQAERFDLYLLDTVLPDLDGFELCRRVRNLDPRTPILFFSGAAYEVDKEKGIEAGANDYISKPDIEGVLGRIRQFVFPDTQYPATNNYEGNPVTV
jgi:two-component system OmpR family response regulator